VKKKILVSVFTGMMTLAMSMTALAAGWSQGNGIMYQYDDGSYAKGWVWIDEDNDGWAECYYFNENGWAWINTDAFGYTLDWDGAWVVDGVVQKKQVPVREDGSNSHLRYVGTYDYKWTIDESTQENFTNDWSGTATITVSENQLYISFGENGEFYQLVVADKGFYQYTFSDEPHGTAFIYFSDDVMGSYGEGDMVDYFVKR